jgi:hypothetical protein
MVTNEIVRIVSLSFAVASATNLESSAIFETLRRSLSSLGFRDVRILQPALMTLPSLYLLHCHAVRWGYKPKQQFVSHVPARSGLGVTVWTYAVALSIKYLRRAAVYRKCFMFQEFIVLNRVFALSIKILCRLEWTAFIISLQAFQHSAPRN